MISPTRWLPLPVALLLLVAGPGGCATGPTYIVPADQPLAGTAPAWTPTPSEVARAERGLRGFIRSLGSRVYDYGHGPLYRRLGSYGRQYVGIMREGRRAIWINLFDVDSPFYERGSERQTLIKVHACGDCNAEVYYDVDRGVYFDWWESAPLIH
jgi:hypothetical protein